MTKRDFLQVLRAHLSQMTPEEREKQLAYYEELFDDMMEDGMTEAEAAAHLGDPALIAEELLSQLPLGDLVKSRVRPEGGWTALNIVLLVLGSPVWLPLLLTAAVLVLVFLLLAWVLVLVYGAVVFSLGAAAVGSLLAIPFGLLSVTLLPALGAALICGGLCLLLALGLPPLCRAVARFCAWLVKKIKSLFIKKEG